MGEMTQDEKQDFYRRFNMLEKHIKDLNDQNTRILNILESDPKIKEKGLVERVSDMQKEVDGILQRESTFKTKLAVISFVAGGVLSAVIWAVQLLISKYL